MSEKQIYLLQFQIFNGVIHGHLQFNSGIICSLQSLTELYNIRTT